MVESAFDVHEQIRRVIAAAVGTGRLVRARPQADLIALVSPGTMPPEAIAEEIIKAGIRAGVLLEMSVRTETSPFFLEGAAESDGLVFRARPPADLATEPEERKPVFRKHLRRGREARIPKALGTIRKQWPVPCEEPTGPSAC